MLETVVNSIVEESWSSAVAVVKVVSLAKPTLIKLVVSLNALESRIVVSEPEVDKSLDLLLERVLDVLDRSAVDVLEIKADEVVVMPELSDDSLVKVLLVYSVPSPLDVESS